MVCLPSTAPLILRHLEHKLRHFSISFILFVVVVMLQWVTSVWCLLANALWCLRRQFLLLTPGSTLGHFYVFTSMLLQLVILHCSAALYHILVYGIFWLLCMFIIISLFSLLLLKLTLSNIKSAFFYGGVCSWGVSKVMLVPDLSSSSACTALCCIQSLCFSSSCWTCISLHYIILFEL